MKRCRRYREEERDVKSHDGVVQYYMMLFGHAM